MDLLKDVYADFFADPSERRRSEQNGGKKDGKPSSTGSKPTGAGSKPSASGNKPSGSGSKPSGAGSRPSGTGSKPSDAGQKPAGAGTKTPSPEDALKNAQDVLDEVKTLFENAPVMPVAAATTQENKPENKEPEKDPEEELESLIGLKDIKHDVRELADFAKVQKMRQEQGMRSVPVSLHLVFTGNPGTGKTTVARILGRMYKKIGILSSGQLIEVDRSGLVAGYVGQTALKVQKVIQSAMGGVLFIDEAYALSQENDPFGQEAIDTILKAMEDHRDNLIVIIAGYTGPMEGFINSNPGLKSRFNKYIEFPDYTVDELEAIFYLNCNKYEYVVDEDAKNQIRTMILLRKVKNPINFANGREVRNMFEEIITNQARRIASMENPSAEDLKRITTDDLWDNAVEEKDKAESDKADSDKADANNEAEAKKADSDKADANEAEVKKADSDKADANEAEVKKAESDKADSGKADQEKTEPDKTGEDAAAGSSDKDANKEAKGEES